jgi:predicted aldo/keto reductase-like oxidoreductase
MEMAKVKKWDNITVSRLGYGCMRFPMKEGRVDRDIAGKMVDKAYKGGVNYFDTGYTYLNGDSESFIGEILSKYPRDSYYIAAKMPVWQINDQKDVSHIFEEQLKKLNMNRIDFYLLHAVNKTRWETVKQFQMLEKIIEEKNKGTIMYLGFSYHGDFDTFKIIVDTYNWDLVQLQLNYADYELENAKIFHNYLIEKGIPCVVMEPVRGGFLANPPLTIKNEMASINPAISPAAWALRWCADLENAPVILSGMNTMEQVRENLEIFQAPKKLSIVEKEMLCRATTHLKNIKAIPCTTCGYCMDCPHGVNIPEIFTLFNNYHLFNNEYRARVEYSDLASFGKGANCCTKCGACELQCPQKINIADKLDELNIFFIELLK